MTADRTGGEALRAREWRVGDVVQYQPGPAFPGQTDVRWCMLARGCNNDPRLRSTFGAQPGGQPE